MAISGNCIKCGTSIIIADIIEPDENGSRNYGRMCRACLAADISRKTKAFTEAEMELRKLQKQIDDLQNEKKKQFNYRAVNKCSNCVYHSMTNQCCGRLEIPVQYNERDNHVCDLYEEKK